MKKLFFVPNRKSNEKIELNLGKNISAIDNHVYNIIQTYFKKIGEFSSKKLTNELLESIFQEKQYHQKLYKFEQDSQFGVCGNQFK